MSVSSNGTVSTAQSMNGLVEINANDIVADTIISDVLISDTIQSQNIYAQDGLVDCSLFNNDYATVSIGNTTTNLLNFGGFQFLVDTMRHITTALNLYLFPTSTGTINFATNASKILFGSSTALVSDKVPTANNHLANKLYVDSGGGILSSDNVFTGTNKFTSPSITPAFVIDAQTAGEVSIDFKTNSSTPTQRNASIVGSGTGSLSGLLTFLAQTFKFTGTSFIVDGATSSLNMLTNTTNTINMNFRTNSATPTQINSSIVASGGTVANGGTIEVNSNTLNLYSGNINFSTAETKLTLNASETSTITAKQFNGQTTASSLVFGNMLLYNGIGTYQISTIGNKNIKCTEQQFTKLILVGYDCPNGVIIILDQTSTSIIDGQEFQIWNMSAYDVSIRTNSSATVANLYAPNLARSGVASIILTSNRGLRVRAFAGVTNATMQAPNGLSVGWILLNNY